MTFDVQFVIANVLLNMVHLSTLSPAETGCRDYQDETCSQDCSQSVPDDKTFIGCAIDVLKDVSKLRYDEGIQPADEHFDAPTLESIAFFWKGTGTSSRAALKVTFRLPKADAKGNFTDVVFLEFQSISNSNDIYYRCPLRRVFRIWKYKHSSTHDLDNPRNLTYDCIVGLDQQAKVSMYNVTLKAARGRSSTYTITLPMEKKNLDENRGEWGPVIATLYDREKEIIFAIVEQEPAMLNAETTNITLEGTDGMHRSKLISRQQRTVTFDKIKIGTFLVKVTYPECKNCETTSYPVETNPPTDSTHVTLDQQHLAVILSVAGSLCAIVVAVAAAYFIIKRKRGSTSADSPFPPSNKLNESLLRRVEWHPATEKRCLQSSNNISKTVTGNQRIREYFFPSTDNTNNLVCTCPHKSFSKSSSFNSKEAKQMLQNEKLEETLTKYPGGGVNHMSHCDENSAPDRTFAKQRISDAPCVAQHLSKPVYDDSYNEPVSCEQSHLENVLYYSGDWCSMESEGSLWDDSSETCCGGRHGMPSCGSSRTCCGGRHEKPSCGSSGTCCGGGHGMPSCRSSGTCCGGRHGMPSFGRGLQHRRSLSDIRGELKSLQLPSYSSTGFHCENRTDNNRNSLAPMLSQIRDFNMSAENLR